MASQHIPDSTGTVAVSGYEELALSFALKHSFLNRLQEEADELKRQLRDVARSVVAGAGPAAAAVKRIFVRNGSKGGVSVSLPDYESTGNRLVLSDKKINEVLKTGELTLPGVGSLADLIEESVSEPGGEVIELRGRWIEWFKINMGTYLKAEDPDIKWEKRERTAVRRLKTAAISVLRGLASTGNEVASLLLAVGLKEPMVKAEEK